MIRGWWLILAMVAAGFVLLRVAGFLAEIPLPEAAPGAQSSKLFDVNGELVYSFHGEENRTIVPLDSMSEHFKRAVLAAEDRSFYTHPGVSFRGIVRAAFSNFRRGEIGQGASTITQQYARTFAEVGKERTYMRKLREATMAVKIEREYSKDKILEFYMNTVYFGRGAYGAEAAAQTYFKKSASELDVAESAYLAGVIRSPSRFQVEASPERVVSLKDQVVGSMLEAGFITADQASEARQVDVIERFKFSPSAALATPRAGFFIEYVRRLLLRDFQIEERDLLGGGLHIHTTLDLRMQDAAEEAVRSTLDRDDDPEVGLLAMDPLGQVKAMVGGRDVDNPDRARGFNFAANLPGDAGGRQPGSALKPVAVAAFVDEGMSIRSSFRAPSKISISSGLCMNDGKPWEVSNFDNASFGTLDITQATTRSVNTIYAQMMDQVVTPKKFIAMSERLGLPIPPVDEGCALALGTTDVTPLEMARVYATFAARGQRPDPIFVLKIVSPQGEVIAERHPRTEQTIDPNVAATVAWMLKQNIAGGTGTGARLPWPAMGKTGTAQDYQDASFVGSTPELTAAVWMGFPPDPTTGAIPVMRDVRGRRVTGGSFPATIWQKFMSEALKYYETHSDFPAPRVTGQVLEPEPEPCPEPDLDGAPGSDGSDGSFTVVAREGSEGDEGNEFPEDCIRPTPTPTPSPDCEDLPEGVCRDEEEAEGSPFTAPRTPGGSRLREDNPCFPFRCETPAPSPAPTPTPTPDPEPEPGPPPTDGPGCIFPFCPPEEQGQGSNPS